MRDVPASMTDAWLSEDKTGAKRPIVRATIQHTQVRNFAYDTYNQQGGSLDSAIDSHTSGVYTSVMFGNNNPVREVRNIESCEWERSHDQDAATCTLTLLNAETLPLGAEAGEDFEQPGYYTFSRGRLQFTQDRWGHEQNGWGGVFVPDALVKTYEGYGGNPDVDPHHDPDLMQTGVWLIDKVSYAGGVITLEMRDLARLLLDQIAFPPIVPYSEYPRDWVTIHDEEVAGRDATGGHWTDLVGKGTASSSNDYYVGHGYMNGSSPYVSSSGGVEGHYAYMGLRDSATDHKDYWLSTPQETQRDVVWWQVDLNDHSTALNALRIHTWGNCTVYISLYGKDGWIGRKKVPYPGKDGDGAFGVDIHADIPFIMSVKAEGAYPFDVTLPRKYGDISKIRLTMTCGHYRTSGDFRWEVGLADLSIYTAGSAGALGFAPGTIIKTVGNYRDYSDIPLTVAAWGGMFHPERSTHLSWWRTDSGSGKVYTAYPIVGQVAHNRLARGRAWGFFQASFTAGVADLTPDMFDKKPLMDMVNYVRDLLGYIFHVDEEGGIIWKMPNIWSFGNRHYYTTGAGTPSDPLIRENAHTNQVVTIDENETLITYETTLSSENVRERIFVANVTGNFGSVVAGYNPRPTGMRRIAGWTDQKFGSRRETLVMADMIAARAMFDYRRGRLTMPGYPRIQIDDQIRILERVTNETFYHYVLGIKSTLNMQDGTWEYDMETHWLGEDPEDAWVIDAKSLKGPTQAYLELMRGKENG